MMLLLQHDFDGGFEGARCRIFAHRTSFGRKILQILHFHCEVLSLAIGFRQEAGYVGDVVVVGGLSDAQASA